MKIAIITHPHSKRPRREEALLGTLHVYANAPPLEGKANRATEEALAKHFKVKTSQVELVSGHKSKNKTFEISL